MVKVMRVDMKAQLALVTAKMTCNRFNGTALCHRESIREFNQKDPVNRGCYLKSYSCNRMYYRELHYNMGTCGWEVI